MTYIITGDCVALTLDESEVIDTTAIEQLITGKEFDSKDALDNYMESLAADNKFLWDSYSYRETT